MDQLAIQLSVVATLVAFGALGVSMRVLEEQRRRERIDRAKETAVVEDLYRAEGGQV